MPEPRNVDLLVKVHATVTDPAMTDEELVQNAVHFVEGFIDTNPSGPYRLSDTDVTVWTEHGYIADLAELAGRLDDMGSNILASLLLNDHHEPTGEPDNGILDNCSLCGFAAGFVNLPGGGDVRGHATGCGTDEIVAWFLDHRPPGELARLYDAAGNDDSDMAALDNLAKRAGLIWDCVWCEHSGGGWTNGERDTICDQCGGPRVTGPITFRCPPEKFDKDSGEEHTILGCGAVFTLQPDEIEALDDKVDCECGMFFDPVPNIVKTP